MGNILLDQSPLCVVIAVTMWPYRAIYKPKHYVYNSYGCSFYIYAHLRLFRIFGYIMWFLQHDPVGVNPETK